MVSKYTPILVFGTGPITKSNVKKKMSFFKISYLIMFFCAQEFHFQKT